MLIMIIRTFETWQVRDSSGQLTLRLTTDARLPFMRGERVGVVVGASGWQLRGEVSQQEVLLSAMPSEPVIRQSAQLRAEHRPLELVQYDGASQPLRKWSTYWQQGEGTTP